MDQPIHPMQQAATLRLLAAALELQHLTSLAANVVPIPGGERVIAIGTAADVAQLLPGQASQTDDLPAILFDSHAVYEEAKAHDPNTHPTSDHVSDVLDAVVRLMRADRTARPAGDHRDAARLDWLERMGNQPEGLLLHDGGDFTGRRGLGLRRIGRTLRQAIDAANSRADQQEGGAS